MRFEEREQGTSIQNQNRWGKWEEKDTSTTPKRKDRSIITIRGEK